MYNAIYRCVEESHRIGQHIIVEPFICLSVKHKSSAQLSDGKFKEADRLDLYVFDNIPQDFVESTDEWGEADPLTHKNNIEKFVNQTVCEKSVG